jgi:hypothetical protein
MQAQLLKKIVGIIRDDMNKFGKFNNHALVVVFIGSIISQKGKFSDNKHTDICDIPVSEMRASLWLVQKQNFGPVKYWSHWSKWHNGGPNIL